MAVVIAFRDAVFARMLALEFRDRGIEAEVWDKPEALSELTSAELAVMDAAYLAAGLRPPARGEAVIAGYPEELAAISAQELTRYFCVVRPFAVEEFFASILPSEGNTSPKELRLQKRKSPTQHLALDEATHIAYYKGEKIQLTAREFALLKLLLERRGHPVSRAEAATAVFGGAEPNTNIVDVYINYLRSKLDNRFRVRLISTVRGCGYMINGDPPANG